MRILISITLWLNFMTWQWSIFNLASCCKHCATLPFPEISEGEGFWKVLMHHKTVNVQPSQTPLWTLISCVLSGDIPCRGNVSRKAQQGNTGLCCQELLSVVIKRHFERGWLQHSPCPECLLNSLYEVTDTQSLVQNNNTLCLLSSHWETIQWRHYGALKCSEESTVLCWEATDLQ